MRTRTKLPLILATLLLTTALLAGCATPTEVPSSAATVAPTRSVVALKIGIYPVFSNAVLKIAAEQGYFAEQGIQAEFVELKSVNDMVTVVASGEVDVSAPALSAGLFNALAGGGQFKVIMPLSVFNGSGCAYVGYVARQADIDSGRFSDKASWQEATMIVSAAGLSSVPGYILDKALGPGGDMDAIRTEKVDVPAQEEALRSEQVDIIYAIEPWITRMSAQGDIGLLEDAEHYVNQIAASLIAVGPKVYNDPDLGLRFATAYLKAVRQYLEGPTTRNIEIMTGFTGLSADLLNKACWSDSAADGVLNVESVMDFQEWLFARGQLDRVVPVEEFYDDRFVAPANAALGPAAP